MGEVLGLQVEPRLPGVREKNIELARQLWQRTACSIVCRVPSVKQQDHTLSATLLLILVFLVLVLKVIFDLTNQTIKLQH